jgi:predicted transcriptional regulator
VSPSPLEAILEHEGRLDVLCCLIDGDSLAIAQLSARTGRPLKAVRHCIKVLEAFDLVEKMETVAGGETFYVANLDKHPDWVREAVEEHRRAGY